MFDKNAQTMERGLLLLVAGEVGRKRGGVTAFRRGSWLRWERERGKLKKRAKGASKQQRGAAGGCLGAYLRPPGR